MPTLAIRPSRQELILIGVTVIWGATFLIVHTAMRHVGPMFFVGARFLTAGVLGLVLFRRQMRGFTRQELVGGLWIGVTVFLGYVLQTTGLKSISASKSAFISALYVPITPILQWLGLRRPPGLMAWLGIGFAFAGLILLAGPEAFRLGLGLGEIVTLLSAIAFAGQIVLIGAFAGPTDPRRVTVIQVLVGSALAFAAMPFAGERPPAFSWVWVACALGLGTTSILIQLAMNWAQRTISPARATVIYAAEPVWGGLFGRLAGDRQPALALLGAALIVAGVIVSELKPKSLAGQNEKVPATDGERC